MSRQPEGRLVKRIREYLESQGATVFNIHGGDNPFQQSGIPDLLCCWRGYFIALAAKQPGEKPSRIQSLRIDRIRQAGGVAEVVTSVPEVKAILRRTLRK